MVALGLLGAQLRLSGPLVLRVLLLRALLLEWPTLRLFLSLGGNES